MIHAHASTVAKIRLLRAIGPLKRRHRMPRQQQPDAIRREYFKAVLPLAVKPSLEAFAVIRPEILRLLTDLRRRQGKMDIAEKDTARRLVSRAAAKAAEAFRPRDLHATAEKFGHRTSVFQKEQLSRQLQAAIGVPLTAIEKPIRDLIPTFAKQNTELLKTVPDRYWDRVAADVEEAFETGMHPDTLAERFVDVDGMAENDARRIARDQIGKLNAQFNEERQTALGITGYVWRGALDNRERDEHTEREGQHFEWDDPPEDGNPGEPVLCRCYAEPDLGPIVDASDE